MALVRSPFTPPPPPPAHIHQLFVDHDWQDTESGLFMLLRNTTAAVIIMLGFMNFGVRYEQDSGKVGAEQYGSKWGCQNQRCVSNGDTLFNERFS